MRPTKKAQQPVWTPLNAILGTEASVRVMRVLSRESRPMSRAEVARRAELDPSGVRRLLDRLMVAGVIEAVGTGTAQTQVALREAHPLVLPLRELFEAEYRRGEEVYNAVRQVADGLAPVLTAVWLDVPRHGIKEGAFDLARVWVFARSQDVDASAGQVRRGLVDATLRYSVDFEVRPLTRADLAAMSERERKALLRADVVFGPHPAAALGMKEAAPRPLTHRAMDQRSRELHAVIADWIARDPTLVDRASTYVRQRVREVDSRTRKEFQEWADLLGTMPTARLRRFLADPGERATRLRQSSPFLPVLTEAERNEVERTAGA